jgi:hypothetical protein
MSTNRPIKAFYEGNVLVGTIRSVNGKHVHIFYGRSGDGRELTRDEFWDRMKVLNTSEHFVRYKDGNDVQ